VSCLCYNAADTFIGASAVLTVLNLAPLTRGASNGRVTEKTTTRLDCVTRFVKYIVQQTLGRYLEERGYNPAHPVRVLDMACGSGSFLIEAFDVLDQYLAREMGVARGEYDIRDHARQMQILTE